MSNQLFTSSYWSSLTLAWSEMKLSKFGSFDCLCTLITWDTINKTHNIYFYFIWCRCGLNFHRQSGQVYSQFLTASATCKKAKQKKQTWQTESYKLFKMNDKNMLKKIQLFILRGIGLHNFNIIARCKLASSTVCFYQKFGFSSIFLGFVMSFLPV